MDFPSPLQPDSHWDPLASEPMPPAAPDASKVILLVDDDIQLRKSMRDFLVYLGFQVLEARDTYDGLFLCAQYGNQIHVLITEINLLPVSGVKLAENVLRLWPHIQILCMSEVCDAPGVNYWMRYLGAQFLRKPFTSLELQAAVFTMLGRIVDEADHLGGNVNSPTSSQFWDREPTPSPAAISHPFRENRSDSQDPNFWLREF